MVTLSICKLPFILFGHSYILGSYFGSLVGELFLCLCVGLDVPFCVVETLI